MFEIGRDCQIHPTAVINVKAGRLGDRSIVGANAIIEGSYVEIGSEAFIDADAWIGGGSCHDPLSELVIGDWLHMGRWSHINAARKVVIGHEFGCGMATRVFSHGAYESAWDGFPVQWDGVSIGDRVWLPHAWVNPGVSIGSDVVVAAMSLVNTSLPSGCLAGGVPIRILKENIYPRVLNVRERFALWQKIFGQALSIAGGAHSWEPRGSHFTVDDETSFDLDARMIAGPVTDFSEIVKNQLRRNGIRFRYTAKGGEYVPWQEF